MVSRREFYLSLVAVGLLAGWLGMRWERQPPGGMFVRAAEAQMLASKPFSFAAVARRATPSVVNVFTTHHVRVPAFGSPLGEGDPFDQFFRQLFPELPREMEQKSLGSGVIVDREGFILTNHHVVANADEIQVKLTDTRSFPAELVGSDARTDVALDREFTATACRRPSSAIPTNSGSATGYWRSAIHSVSRRRSRRGSSAPRSA